MSEYRREYWVCFKKCKEWRWWQIFTGPKRQHIFLITPCNDMSCVMIEMSEGGAGVYAFNEPASEIAGNVIDQGEDAVRYVVEEKDMTKPRFKMFRSCVGMAKDFLGIDDPFIITPNQLYNRITRGGSNG